MKLNFSTALKIIALALLIDILLERRRYVKNWAVRKLQPWVYKWVIQLEKFTFDTFPRMPYWSEKALESLKLLFAV